MQRLPFFYHIPKNAGTYFLSYSLVFGRFYIVDTIGYPAVKYLRHIEIKKQGKICARIIAADKEGFCKQNEKMKQQPGPDITLYQMTYDDFKSSSLETLKPLVFIVEADGFSSRNMFLDCMKDYQPFECLIDRNPVSRQKSLYRYLTSSESAHELTYGNFSNSLSFDDYIKNHIEEEDCWLLRALFQKQYPEKICMNDFNALCEILNSFYIRDISRTNDFIDAVFKTCYDIHPDQLIKKYRPRALKNLDKNENLSKKPIENYNEDALSSKLYWANKLYEKYCL